MLVRHISFLKQTSINTVFTLQILTLYSLHMKKQQAYNKWPDTILWHKN